MRKLFLFSISLICLLGGGYFVFFDHAPSPQTCAFCDKAVLSHQTFYEDDLVLALYTHKPIFPGHCLVIPKRHVQRFEQLTDAEMLQIGQVIKKVNQAVMNVFETPSYLLLQKNGREVGQTVPHVHFHYVPRKAGDNSSLQFMAKMYIANAKQPLSPAQMHKTVEQLREATILYH